MFWDSDGSPVGIRRGGNGALVRGGLMGGSHAPVSRLDGPLRGHSVKLAAAKALTKVAH